MGQARTAMEGCRASSSALHIPLDDARDDVDVWQKKGDDSNKEYI